MQVAVIGMVWYRNEDWEELRALFTDTERLHVTYDAWKEAAERGERRLIQQGHRVIRAEIHPREFAAWCAEKRVEANAVARNAFANEVAYASAKRDGMP
jgi:hypothetical protein